MSTRKRRSHEHRKQDDWMIVITGPAAGGKTSTVRELKQQCHYLVPTISVTTRKPRPDETEGEDYFFQSVKKFRQMRRENLFLETTRRKGPHGYNFYGTLFSEVERVINSANVPVFVIDHKGARVVRSRWRDALVVSIDPRSIDVLRQRLQKKRKSGLLEIKKRLIDAKHEMDAWHEASDILVYSPNRSLPRTITDVRRMIKGYLLEKGFPIERLLKDA